MSNTATKIVCIEPGYSASRMWTAGRTYTAEVVSEGRQLLVRDNLGHERVMSNVAEPTFPMGTTRDWPRETAHTARFAVSGGA